MNILERIRQGLTPSHQGFNMSRENRDRLEEIRKMTDNDRQGLTNLQNPFIIAKKEQINPIDPNRTIEEQKRLRKNWFNRQSYQRRKQKEKQKQLLKTTLTEILKQQAKEKTEKEIVNNSFYES